jgi:hypothetical protein
MIGPRDLPTIKKAKSTWLSFFFAPACAAEREGKIVGNIMPWRAADEQSRRNRTRAQQRD